MPRRHLIVPLLLIGLAACQPPQKYYWGGYSSALYDYYADPAAEAAYEKTLDDIVGAEAKGQKVPPGMYAEYGYEELSRGNADRAVDLFRHEKQAWPESAAFMDKAIALAQSGRRPGGSSKAPPAAQSLPSSDKPSS